MIKLYNRAFIDFFILYILLNKDVSFIYCANKRKLINKSNYFLFFIVYFYCYV